MTSSVGMATSTHGRSTSWTSTHRWTYPPIATSTSDIPKRRLVCSFCPCPYDFHPKTIPALYNHSNVDSDEVLYDASSEFMSREGIEFGSIMHHPSGWIAAWAASKTTPTSESHPQRKPTLPAKRRLAHVWVERALQRRSPLDPDVCQTPGKPPGRAPHTKTKGPPAPQRQWSPIHQQPLANRLLLLHRLRRRKVE
jgi:hypothetical protein